MLKCEKCIHKKICIDGANYKNAEACRNFINENDIVLVKHGHWHWSVECFHDVCSCCAHLSKDSNDLENYPYKFFPHCGAKMDG